MCTWKLQGQNVMFAPVLSKEPVAPEKSARLCVFGGHCVDMWWLYTNCHFFAVLAVFWLFLTIGTLLVHCWYSIDRTDTTGTATVIFAVLTVYWLFLTIGTNRHRSTKTVPTMYHQCTNRKKQSKTVKRQSKQQQWPLVYQSSHVYTESAEYTKPRPRSPSVSASAVRVRVRRITKPSAPMSAMQLDCEHWTALLLLLLLLLLTTVFILP